MPEHVKRGGVPEYTRGPEDDHRVQGRDESPDTYVKPGAACHVKEAVSAAHAGLQPPTCRGIWQRLRCVKEVR
jgi:hypothetical protein